MNSLSLPPRLSGSPKGTLEVRIDLLKTLNDGKIREKPKYVKLQWWGQRMEQATKLMLSPGCDVTYNILTRPDKFKEYLADAGRLYVEALSQSGQNLGFAVVERLERIVDLGGITADDVEVFNQDGEVVALLRCIFIFEELIEDEDADHGGKKVQFAIDDHDYDEVEVERDSDEDTLREMMKKSVARMTLQENPKSIENTKAKISQESNNKLPSWNLSTDRIKYISKITNLKIRVRNVTLNPAVVQHVPTFNSSKASRVKPSFFIKYSLPGEDQQITFCASKQSKPRQKNDNVLIFDGIAEHPIRFTTSVLDNWWVSNLTFSLCSRLLGQRLPLHIGDTNLALKYLLINSKYSSGNEMKLPIYSSTGFRKHLEPHYKEEIIGDVHLTFDLLCNPAGMPKITPNPSINSMPKPKEKVQLESKKQKIQLESKRQVDTKEMKSHQAADLVLCLLRIDQGRNFSTEANSLYVTCRLFSHDKHVSSSVAWNSNSRPKFELQHVVPIDINDEDFLLNTCKDNHLVVEVWNFSEPTSTMIGVTTVSLHQFYTTFHNQSLAKRHLSGDLPVIATHDWLSVRDLLTGGKVVGEIRVLLAAGLGTQIYRLNLLMDEEQIKDESPTPSKEEPEKVESLEDETDDINSPSDWLWFSIAFPEGRNLPMISSQNQREPPMTYVTVGNGLKSFTSDMVKKSCHPQWAFQVDMALPDELLTNPKRQLIAKVWHKDANACDYVIGFVAVDLGILLHDGFTEISGWYNIMDFVGRCRGQVKVVIQPHVDAKVLKEKYSVKTLDVVTQKKPEEEQPLIKQTCFWNPPKLSEEKIADDDRKVLEERLSELEHISKKLKSRLVEDGEPEDERQTLERLRNSLASQFQNMQSILSKSQESEPKSRMAPDGGNPPDSSKDS